VNTFAASLPDFPWDRLAPYGDRARAAAGDDGVVDVSIGTPVDSTPSVVQQALAAASDAPGYPTTAGTPQLREAAAAWMQRRLDVGCTSLLPTIGSKEIVAWLPTLLGLGVGDVVVVPAVAYPTYDVGARLVGATVVASDEPWLLPDQSRIRLVWLNSPANPTGQVWPVEHLATVVAWARSIGALVVSDECYIELGWGVTPVSVLHRSVVGEDHTGVLAVHSLSKRSNFAGYRFGFIAGDPGVIGDLLAVRKHLGMLVPAPVAAAAIAALGDDEHVAVQRERYGSRRSLMLAALTGAGFRVEHSEAGLYLWTTRDEDCWASVEWFADRGILVTPGAFYGVAGERHVRIALTATDERVAAFVARLA